MNSFFHILAIVGNFIPNCLAQDFADGLLLSVACCCNSSLVRESAINISHVSTTVGEEE